MMSYDYDALVASIMEARRQALLPVTVDVKGDYDMNTTTTATTTTTTTTTRATSENETTTTLTTTTAHRLHSLQQALQHFDTLSGTPNHCPMTPMLWILYADTASRYFQWSANQQKQQQDDGLSLSSSLSSSLPMATVASMAAGRELALQILQLGLTEFPGSILLQLYHVDQHVLLLTTSTTTTTTTATATTTAQQQKQYTTPSFTSLTNDTGKEQQEPEQQQQQQQHLERSALLEAIQMALDVVGRGSHTSEASWVIALYKLQAFILAQEARHVLIQQGYDGIDLVVVDEKETTNRLQIHAYQLRLQQLWQSWLRRAETPCGNLNQGFDGTMVKRFLFKHGIPWSDFLQANQFVSLDNSNNDDNNGLQQTLEQARYNNEAKVFASTTLWTMAEQDVAITMHQEGLALPPIESLQANTIQHDTDDSKMDRDFWELDWTALLSAMPGSIGMGLGSFALAQAFSKHATALYQSKTVLQNFSFDETDSNYRASMLGYMYAALSTQCTWSAYERGVAECPTVEALWLSYISHLIDHIRQIGTEDPNSSHRYHTTQTDQQPSTIKDDSNKLLPALCRRLESVVQRAARNCPYSVLLVQEQLQASLILAQHEHIVLDPDSVLNIVQQALLRGFLPIQEDPAIVIRLYQRAIQTVVQRILFLLALVERSSAPQSQHESFIEFDEVCDIMQKKNPNQKKLKQKDDEHDGKGHDESHSDEYLEELHDLAQDLPEMYEQVQVRLRQLPTLGVSKVPHWNRSILNADQAQVEALVLQRLRFLNTEVKPQSSLQVAVEAIQRDDVWQSWQKAIKAYNPPHPDLYRHLIQHFIHLTGQADGSMACQISIVSKLQYIRFLFAKAIESVGMATKALLASHNNNSHTTSTVSTLVRDYPTALSNLCYEWIEFERLFGSTRSMVRAHDAVSKKLERAAALGPHQRHTTAIANVSLPMIDQSSAAINARNALDREKHQEDATTSTSDTVNETSFQHDRKRKDLMDDADEEVDRALKKTKVANASFTDHNPDASTLNKLDSSMQSSTTSEKKKDIVPKVRVGTMDYPAHPFTVRVSNLSLDTEDMDLVDAFRPKCGSIVHAKIIREKPHLQHHQHHHYHGDHNKPKSQGWGLIQFEDRESVNTALSLDDVMGIRDRIVHVQRSHVPAVTLVPPGMHRIQPQGLGKNSKRNQKRKEQYDQQQQQQQQMDPPPPQADAAGPHREALTRSATTTPIDDAKQQHQKQLKASSLTIRHHGGGVESRQSHSGGGGLLDFRPRGVARMADRPKPKVNLSSNPAESLIHKQSLKRKEHQPKI